MTNLLLNFIIILLCRNTQGVTLIKTQDETVVSVARIAHSGNKDVDSIECGEYSEEETSAKE